MISEKIVVVDDDARIHQSLKAVLFEYQIISFQDPLKALEFISKPNEIKLAIIDVRMNGLNGIELLEKLKKAKPNIAVIIVTAHGTQDIIVEAMRMHADDYLEKPFDIQELRDRVRILLKERLKFDASAHDPKTKSERIRNFIQENYKNASLEFIAKEMCLSTQYLGRLFTKNDDLGFRGYKLKIKMDKAMDLLAKSSLSITEIGFQLGYKNPESFMRAFKHYSNETPTSYRNKSKISRKKT